VRNIAEGANRMHPRDQIARFTVARGECGECEAALQMVQVLSLAPAAKLIELRRLADRVAAMVWGLVRRLRE
jgi:four helix bundle protein